MVWDGAQEFGFLTDSVGSAETGSLQATCAGYSRVGGRSVNNLSFPSDTHHAVLVGGDYDVFRNKCQFAAGDY